MTVRREGSGHDRDGGEGPKSAAEIRRMTARGEDVNAFLPGPAAAVYAAEQRKGRIIDAERTELAVMSRLRMLSEADFRLIPDAGNGVGERLYRAAHEETNLNAVMAAAKTKRYALSRIRRMCMCAALGVKAGMNSGVPPYIRVLAANERGCAVLRRIQDNASVPVITKPATAKMLSSECMDVFATGVYAHDLYVLGYRAEGERKGGEDWRISPIIVKNP